MKKILLNIKQKVLTINKKKIMTQEKINIAELLKDCPTGMELYSPIFGKVYLDKIRPHLAIVVATDKEQGDFKEEFLYDGRYGINGECMLFPSKGKTTWEGFLPPCKFKDGDIVSTIGGGWIGIVKKPFMGAYETYITIFDEIVVNNNVLHYFDRLATEEEKQKLFKAIKEHGYKWNAETKTLDKLVEPKFKVEDTIQDVDGYKVEIYKVDIDEECYEYISIIANGIGSIPFEQQDKWELVPNKFDITTLKPFDKVLVRDNDEQMWTTDIFSFYNEKHVYHFMCVGHYTNQCIPFEGNEHLLGKTDDCDEFYKTWA